jgi:hypothetical protein
MDVDALELQAQRAYLSPQLWKERRCRGQCMQCSQMGHIMKNCPRGYPSKWNKQLANNPPCQQNAGRNWAPQPNHTQWPPSRPPQYTPKKNPGYRAGDNDNIVHDRSPLQTPLQVNPTTNPGKAEQVLNGMTQNQPMRWRDINNQDFP